MCWTTFNIPKKLITEEDIPIFKVCVKSSRINDGTVVYSYFKYYCYEINKVYNLTDQILLHPEPGTINIYHGYHSYLASDCKFEKDTAFNRWVVRDKNLRYLCAYEHFAVKVSGYIPKGSEYYVNEQSECVSNSICLTNVEKLLYVLD